MELLKDLGGGNGCELEEGETIFTPDMYAIELVMPLKQLTQATKATRTIHDFREAVIGKGVVNDFPLKGETAGVREMHLFSPAPIKDGDMIIMKNHDGDVSLRMVFDTQADAKTGTLYKVHAVPYMPNLKIGHELS